MKINNITEFKEMLEFVFSDYFKDLESLEQKNIKNAVEIASSEIKGAYDIMETLLKDEFNTNYDRFVGNEEKIFFIFQRLPEENKVKIVREYLQGKIKDNSYKDYEHLDIPMPILKEILLPMTDCLNEEQKIKVFSKAKTKDLLKIMSEINSEYKSFGRFDKRKKYYKEYYSICQKALEIKELR